MCGAIIFGAQAHTHAADGAIHEMRVDASDDVSFPPARDAVATVLFVKEGLLGNVYSAADGSEAITAFHGVGELVHEAQKRVPGLRFRAFAASRVCAICMPRGVAELVSVAYQSAVDRLAAVEAHVLCLNRRNPAHRLALFLTDLVDRQRRLGRPGRRVSLPKSREDVANYLAVQPESVSRALNSLARAGLVTRLKWPDVEIVDRDGLARYGGVSVMNCAA